MKKCETCRQDIESEEEVQARQARLVGLITTSFQGAVDPSVLPAPESLENSLVRVLAGIWHTYFFEGMAGVSIAQTDIAAVLAHLRDSDDAWLAPLQPQHRMMLKNLFVLPMQEQRRRNLESKGISKHEPETADEVRACLSAATP